MKKGAAHANNRSGILHYLATFPAPQDRRPIRCALICAHTSCPDCLAVLNARRLAARTICTAETVCLNHYSGE
jgi:hypothetical protein